MSDPAQAEQASQGEKSKVFISYSRKDAAFTEKLRAALIARGFNAFLDKEDILPGEDWRARLDGLILEADAVIFVISPDSIASEHCAWEVARTLALKKTLTPLVWRPIPDDAAPQDLAARNYVFFDAYERSGMADEGTFDTALGKLETALDITNQLWVREHTKWVARAIEWERAEPSRPEGKLLRAGDAAAADAWARLRPSSAPNIPPVLTAFLTESIAKEVRDAKRMRRITGRAFVKPAEQALTDELPEQALRLVAAGAVLAQDIDLELVPELWSPAVRAISASTTIAALGGRYAALSPDGRRIVTSSGDSACVWDTGTGKEIALLKVDKERFRSSLLSPDGRRVVTLSNDNAACMWDAENGKEIAYLKHRKHKSDHFLLKSASFSPDGRRIVTASEDATARVWDAENGKALLLFEAHSNGVKSAVFSPNGQQIVTTSLDSTRVWDAKTAKEIIRLEGGDHAAFSSDGRRLLAIHSDEAWVYDVESRTKIAVLSGHSLQVLSAVFSPDGRQILTASADNTARVWNAVSGNQISVLTHTGYVNRACFSPDGHKIVTASNDRTARVWDAQTGAGIFVLKGHELAVWDATFTPDSRRVLTTSGDHTTRIWAAQCSKEIAAFFPKDRIDFAFFSHDGRRIATTSEERPTQIWDVESGAEIVLLAGVGRSFSADGRHIVTTTDDVAHVFDAENGAEIALLKGHKGSVQNAVFSPDGLSILTSSADNTARIWDARRGDEIIRIEGRHGAAFSSDGRRILTVSDDCKARIWDAESGKQTLQRHNCSTAWLSPDGRRIVTTEEGSMGTASVIDAENGAVIAKLKGHQRRVNRGTFSPDSRRIATWAINEREVRVWNVETGSEIVVLNGHTESMSCVTFSSDGRRILTGAGDGTARVWDAESGVEIELFKVSINPFVNGNINIASFSPDGRRIVTASTLPEKLAGFDRYPVRVWDASRTEITCRERAIALTAALARGIGSRPASESNDLLMQEAPEDLFTEASTLLGDRCRAIDEIVAALHASHPHCYLSPTQFIEKFGGPRARGPEDFAESGSSSPQAREPNPDAGTPLPSIAAAHQGEQYSPVLSQSGPSRRRNSRTLWLLVMLLAVLVWLAVMLRADIVELLHRLMQAIPR
jgi:WD40 repeat protein